jgi:uncharacterized protein (DUF486 family)
LASSLSKRARLAGYRGQLVYCTVRIRRRGAGNRIGYFQYQYTPAQLKIMQEAITIGVFAIFALVVLQQPLRWNYFVSFGLLIGAVAVIFV